LSVAKKLEVAYTEKLPRLAGEEKGVVGRYRRWVKVQVAEGA
jgi:hypothetical protein